MSKDLKELRKLFTQTPGKRAVQAKRMTSTKIWSTPRVFEEQPGDGQRGWNRLREGENHKK